MDFSKIATITIAYEDLQALLHGQTNNPITESEVPQMLRAAIAAGVKVILTDVHKQQSLALRADSDGRFTYGPLA